MAMPDLLNISGLMDDTKCFAFVREKHWPKGVRCPGCNSEAVIRDGCDDTQPCRQRYRCKACGSRLDDLTGTVLAGHHQPLRMWVLCLFFMGLNLSNRQIALELGLSPSDAQAITEQLRWSRHGADLLLQVRCAVYNSALGSGFGQLFQPAPGSGSQRAQAA